MFDYAGRSRKPRRVPRIVMVAVVAVAVAAGFKFASPPVSPTLRSPTLETMTFHVPEQVLHSTVQQTDPERTASFVEPPVQNCDETDTEHSTEPGPMARFLAQFNQGNRGNNAFGNGPGQGQGQGPGQGQNFGPSAGGNGQGGVFLDPTVRLAGKPTDTLEQRRIRALRSVPTDKNIFSD